MGITCRNGRDFPYSYHRERIPTKFWALSPLIVREQLSVALSHQICDNLLGQLQEAKASGFCSPAM